MSRELIQGADRTPRQSASPLKTAWRLATYMLLTGREHQSFLGARFLPGALRGVPTRFRRPAALFLLSLSPHYFYRHRAPNSRNYTHFLELEDERNRSSRQKLCDLLLAPRLRREDVVLDYGCGPGYLAKAVSQVAQRVYACDLSGGVIACARVINPGPTITYLTTTELAADRTLVGKIDAVYSIAVIQHVTDDVFEGILRLLHQLLKPGGRLMLHVQLEDPRWRNEAEWRNDASMQGRLRFRWGLNGFARKEDDVRAQIARHGFTNIAITRMDRLISDHFDDVVEQHWVEAAKAR